MKNLKTTLTLALLLFFMVLIYITQNVSSSFTGRYFSQKPPGMSPKIFAPGIITTEYQAKYSRYKGNIKQNFPRPAGQMGIYYQVIPENN